MDGLKIGQFCVGALYHHGEVAVFHKAQFPQALPQAFQRDVQHGFRCKNGHTYLILLAFHGIQASGRFNGVF